MSSPVVAATLQAAVLAGISNVLAQAISAYQSNKPFALDVVPLARFIIWALISTPPNFYWQTFLEETFPSTTVDAKDQQRLSKTNTVKKFVLDQSIGTALNTAAFLAGMSSMKGKNVTQIEKIVQQEFWPLVNSGWKVWPLVSVLSFTLIPANKRILFGSTVGLFWGIYLSLIAA